MVGDQGSFRMTATLTEVIPPERLGWVEPDSGMHTTGTLVDRGDGSTGVIIHQQHVPEPMRAPEAHAGLLTSLDKLEEHLGNIDKERS